MTRDGSRTALRWRSEVEQLSLAEAIDHWEFHNRTEGKSPNTVVWYNQQLKGFERFLEREGGSTLLAAIGEREVRAYIAYLQQKRKWDDTDLCPTSQDGLSPGGIQNRVRALKAFFAWLHRAGYTESHRLQDLPNYRIPRRVVDVLTEEEIGRVLAACDRKSEWGARAYAVLTLMLDSGLRISEVIGLRTGDLELEAGWLKVLGKGGKERIVPFGAATQRALWQYQRRYRPEPLGQDVYFFLTIDGRPL
ncbi:MAG: tyrosine-type recombinase/integrase, partial [Chloroflexi bacterium]|nr:tyrosine-type recombinase/integrase [Chloroflexota bacterium]